MRNNMQVMFPLQASAGAGALVYKDTVSSASDLPSSSEAQVGWLYIADTAFLLNGEQIEIGDELYWNGSEWNIVQGNITIKDQWELKGVRSATYGSIHMRIYKNGAVYSGTLYAKTSEASINGSGYVDIDRTLTYMNETDGYSMSYDMNISSTPTVFLGVSFYSDSARTQYLFSASITITPIADSIANNDKRLARADQVYQALQNVQFDINSLTTETATPTLVGMEDIETALEGI